MTDESGRPTRDRDTLGWWLWMLAALVFGGWVVGAAVLLGAVLDALEETVGASGGGFRVLAAIVTAAAVWALVRLLAGYADRRLNMPRQAWFAMALPVAVFCAAALLDAVNGSYGPLFPAGASSVGLLAAWLTARRAAKE